MLSSHTSKLPYWPFIWRKYFLVLVLSEKEILLFCELNSKHGIDHLTGWKQSLGQAGAVWMAHGIIPASILDALALNILAVFFLLSAKNLSKLFWFLSKLSEESSRAVLRLMLSWNPLWAAQSTTCLLGFGLILFHWPQYSKIGFNTNILVLSGLSIGP